MLHDFTLTKTGYHTLRLIQPDTCHELVSKVTEILHFCWFLTQTTYFVVITSTEGQVLSLI